MVKDMVEPPRMVRRLEVITGAGGRRRWSAAEKARILQETLAPGAVVSQVARRHGLSPQHLFTWRRLARRAMATAPQWPPVTFVPAVIAPEPSEPAPPPPARPRRSRRQGSSTGIELEIAGILVRIGAHASEAAITAVIRALKASP